jgi:hypothetical protein
MVFIGFGFAVKWRHCRKIKLLPLYAKKTTLFCTVYLFSSNPGDEAFGLYPSM